MNQRSILQSTFRQLQPAEFCRLAVLLLAISLVTPTLWASSYLRQGGVKFERLTTGNGLSDNHVLCYLQDSDGFLWFGTRDGLNRFDGYTFRTFNYEAENPHSLSDSHILCLFEDSQRNLWIGTQNGGLNKFDRIRERLSKYTYSPTDSATVSSNEILALNEDRQGNIWVLSAGSSAAICMLDVESGKVRRVANSIFSHNTVSLTAPVGVASDAAGAIWVGVDGSGLYTYEQNRFDRVPAPAGPALERFTANKAYHLDAAGSLWFGDGPEFYSFSPEKSDWRRYTIDSSLFETVGGHEIISFYRDSLGTLWLGTRSGGLLCYDPARDRTDHFSRSNNPNSLAGNRVYCIGEDHSGNIWIGTSGGISKVTKSRWYFGHLRHDTASSHGLNHSRVKSIYEDMDGSVWIGTGGGGLNRMDLFCDSIQVYKTIEDDQHSLSNNVVNCIAEDSDGRLWMGTSSGLNVFDRYEERFERHFSDSVPGALRSGGMRIQRFVIDFDGNFWIGTNASGLYRFDPLSGELRQFVHDPANAASIPHQGITALLLDRGGRLWIGTLNGLSSIDIHSGAVTRYRYPAEDKIGPGGSRIRHILEDQNGLLWLATAGAGIVSFDPESGDYDYFTDAGQLSCNIVCGILADARNNLWLSTAKGISKFMPHERAFKHFTARDGLDVVDFRYGTCFRNEAGELYFGGDGGLVLFHPANVQDNPHAPSVRLTSFRLLDVEQRFDTAISAKRTIVLEHDQNFFSIGFAALDYTNPEQNTYSFILENYDEYWRKASGLRRLAQYTSVPPGSYRFRVIGMNNNGIASEEEAWVAIVVEPAVYQTWWFTALMIALAAAIVIGLVLFRIKIVRDKAELSGKIVAYRLQALRSQMNPHFIFNSLNSIVSLIMEKDTKGALLYLTKFAKLMRSVLENSKNDTISLAEEIKALGYYLELEALRFEDKYDYAISSDPAVDLDEVEVPPLLVQPYVENAIGHGLANRSSKGKLEITVRKNGRSVVCSVIDNGIGRRKSQQIKERDGLQHRSMGMDVTRERMEVMSQGRSNGFDVKIIDLFDEREQAAGTQVDIFIPLD